MKRLLFSISLLAGLTMISCQDNIEEIENPVNDNAVVTRAFEIRGITDYYWSEGKRVAITRNTEKSYVIFKASDEVRFKNSMLKAKIPLLENQINDLSYEGTDMRGRNAKDFVGYKWAEVDLSVEQALSYDEVVYAAPYYKGPADDTYPMTNFIYVYLKNEDLTDLQKMANLYNVGLIGHFNGVPNLYVLSCTKDSKGNALKVANAFAESKLFDGAEPAFMSLKVSSGEDPWLSKWQWNLVETTEEFGTTNSHIKFESALSLMPNASNIVVAVIDNGVDLNHPDLLLHSFSWNVGTSSSPSVTYTYASDANTQHGTNVAGIISGIYNNTIGIAGIASKSGVKVMSFSISFNSSLLQAQAAAAIIKATDMGAAVINNSWNGGTSNQAVNNAIDYAVKNGRYGRGSVVVFSSGNYDLSSVVYPANYTPAEDVIAVGGIKPNGQRMVQFNAINVPSAYGYGLDLVAPGVCIPTTRSSITYSNEPYTYDFHGTSAAAPHVSAVAALILSVSPYISNRDVEYIINATANKSIAGFTTYSNSKYGTRNTEVGYGLLDAYAALSMATSTISGGSSVGITGTNTLAANGNGFVNGTLTASSLVSGCSYVWSGMFVGECTSWSITPSGTYSTGPIANITVNINSSQAGGTFIVTCRAYNGSTYIGSASQYIPVTP